MKTKISKKKMISFGNISLLRNKYHAHLERYKNLEYFPAVLQRSISISTADSMENSACKFGFSVKELRLSLGKPIFQTKLSFNSNYQVLIYEKKIAGIQLIFEYHFFNNKLFFYNKTFPKNYFWTNDEMEILEMFCRKYGIVSNQPIMGTRIVDLEGKCVYVDISNNLTINNLDVQGEAFAEFLFSIEKKTLLKKLKIQNIQLSEN